MIIEEKDFILTCNQGYCWDLELLQTIKPKGKPERQEFQIEGYSMPLERCLQHIVNYRLNKKQDTYSLKEYLQYYKEEVNNIKKLIKNED